MPIEERVRILNGASVFGQPISLPGFRYNRAEIDAQAAPFVQQTSILGQPLVGTIRIGELPDQPVHRHGQYRGDRAKTFRRWLAPPGFPMGDRGGADRQSRGELALREVRARTGDTESGTDCGVGWGLGFETNCIAPLVTAA